MLKDEGEARFAGAAPRHGVDWTCRHFRALSPALLYRVLALRSAVFVVEQRCVYLDPDGDDEQAWMVIGRPVPNAAVPDAAGGRDDDSRPVLACARLLAPGVRYAEASIGRVCTAAAVRGRGLGRTLMAQAIAAAGQRHPGHDLRISAQAHLAGFYASLGFETVSAPYDEDGIPHVAMRRPARTSAAADRAAAAGSRARSLPRSSASPRIDAGEGEHR